MYKAIGINTGPGTFLLGAQKYLDVLTNLCPGTFGSESCRDNGISTTIVPADYSTWPNMHVSAVLANSERWETVQSIVKYVLATKTPIGVIDLRASFFHRYESFLNSMCELCFDNSYRVCYVLYSRLTFDTGSAEERLSFVVYNKEMNFNLTAPPLPEVLKTLFDSIGHSVSASVTAKPEGEFAYDRNDYYEVNYDESLCLPKLRKGYGIRQMSRYHRNELPGGCRKFIDHIKDDETYIDFHKTGWGLKLLSSDFMRYRFVHPQYDRQFTIGEMMSIFDISRQPIGAMPIEQLMYGTPALAGQWLALQVEHYLSDKWGPKDSHIEYRSKQKKFVGGDANPLRPKKFMNISEYVNMVYKRENTEIFPKKKRKFDDNDFVIY